MIYIFGYGALTCPKTMLKRCPSAREVGAARLDGYELIIRDVSSIHPKLGSSVYGAVWSIDSKDLGSLDKSEGYPWKYLRKIEDVSIGNTSMKVWVYQFAYPDYEDHLRADDKYYDTCKSGYTHWKLDFKQFEDAQAVAAYLEVTQPKRYWKPKKEQVSYDSQFDYHYEMMYSDAELRRLEDRAYDIQANINKGIYNPKRERKMRSVVKRLYRQIDEIRAYQHDQLKFSMFDTDSDRLKKQLAMKSQDYSDTKYGYH